MSYIRTPCCFYIKYWPQPLPEDLMWLLVEGTGSGGMGRQMVVVGLRVQAGRVMSAGATSLSSSLQGGLSHLT